ncbi:phage tail sheath subtilisin-like domain-containing protein [Clostridium botulinum]|nr:phage tail sheath subtilisin-like domain-containing protein [Clostridium botulinum]
MGLPKLNIIFRSKGANAIKRGERGIVALILKEKGPLNNPINISTITDIPIGFTEENKEQIELTLRGGINSPKKVIVYTLSTEHSDYSEALSYLEVTKFNYLAVPFVEKEDTSSIATWIKDLRDKKDIKIKAVLPHASVDHEGVINFDTDNIKVGGKTYSAAQYCGRIAGILSGTPLNMSATYMVLPEVDDVPHLTKEEADKAIDEGKLILINDGEKCKIARAINSLTTITKDKGEEFKKILIIDKNDMWHDDVKRTIEDNYLGKYANNYDNKIILLSAIQAYNDQLVLEGLLDNSSVDYNKVFIDVDSQKNYLKSIGENIDKMNEQQIKETNTKDKVFIGSNIKWTDAMEDFNINATI